MPARRYEISLGVLKNIARVSVHSKRNFASPRGHAMFYLLYKHRWNTKYFFFAVKGAINNIAIAIIMVIFSHVEISCFRAKVHLVFHWCLHNKSIFLNSCSSYFTLQHTLHQSIKLSHTKRWISFSSGHFRLFRIPLISRTMGDVDPLWRSKDDSTSWLISHGKTEAQAKRDTFLIKASAEVVEVKVLFKEINFRWSSLQAVRSLSIARWTIGSLNVFSTWPPIAAPIPPTAAAATKLAPKVKGAAKTATAPAPITSPTVLPVAVLYSPRRSLTKLSNILLVCLLIGIQRRKALRRPSIVWWVTKERKSKYVNLASKLAVIRYGGNQSG